MAFAEDLTPYFADFGDAATLAGVAVRVIFDGPGGLQGGSTIESPQVQIASASVPAMGPRPAEINNSAAHTNSGMARSAFSSQRVGLRSQAGS